MTQMEIFIRQNDICIWITLVIKVYITTFIYLALQLYTSKSVFADPIYIILIYVIWYLND